ncbi:Protein transport protein sec16 [Abeliophyllum distichum]|uniref:Protein transport protein sec16 n=1 Tax=Abeliophyllum distichum TaxID=126358 RepID=A0ABD1V243_9LAMI
MFVASGSGQFLLNIVENVYFIKLIQRHFSNRAETATTESVTDWNQVLRVSDITTSTANWNQVLPASNDATNAVSDWNQASQANNRYPQHMVFYPEYPGWYYDTVAQEWRSLDSYTSSAQFTQAQDQVNQNGYAVTVTFSHNNDQKTYSGYDQVNNYASQGFSSQGQDHKFTTGLGPSIITINRNQLCGNLKLLQRVTLLHNIIETNKWRLSMGRTLSCEVMVTFPCQNSL